MRAERFARALLALAFCVALWTQLTALAPSRGAAPTFNSDSAIPVLMANDAHWDAFRLYFYGQDRFGAWPFWLAHLRRFLTGVDWTPDSLHVWQTFWLFSGVLAAALLARRREIVGGAAVLLAIGLPGLVRQMDADLAQPYAWQIAALLWAWLALRAWVEAAWPGWRGAVAAAAVQLLAIWISTLSAPLLAAVALLELWRARSSQPRPASWRVAGRALLPVALGTAAEASLRAVYHRAALASFHYPFVTHLRLDWGHLAANAVAVSHRLLQADCWPALLVASLGAAFAARALRRRDPRVELELAILTLGLTALALLPIPVLVAVSHVRENLFNERFFTPTLCFGQAAAVAAGMLGLEAALPQSARERAHTLLAAVALVGLVALRPPSTPNPAFERWSRTAEALVARAPGSPLINGYWSSYLYAALVPPGTLTALPTEGEYGRTPFDLEKVHGTVVVGNAGSLGPLSGAPWLWEYGEPLRLLQQSLFREGADSFALYEDVADRGLKLTASAPPGDWRLGADQRPLELQFAAVQELTVLVERADLKANIPQGLQVSGAGSVRLPVRRRGMPSGFEVHVGPSDPPFSTLELRATEPVALRALLLWKG